VILNSQHSTLSDGERTVEGGEWGADGLRWGERELNHGSTEGTERGRQAETGKLKAEGMGKKGTDGEWRVGGGL